MRNMLGWTRSRCYAFDESGPDEVSADANMHAIRSKQRGQSEHGKSILLIEVRIAQLIIHLETQEIRQRLRTELTGLSIGPGSMADA